MATMDADVTGLFLEFSRSRLLERYWPRLKASVETLTDEQVWWRPNDASNSIGNLVLHLNGNVRQWLVDSFEEREDKRDRPAEFASHGGMTAAELLERLGATIDEAAKVLARLTEADLLVRFEIQGYHVSGLEAVYQVVEHFGMHYGQIAYISKSLSGKDLGFYRELTKTGRAEGSARLK
ncbi:MAG: DinB family protein [Terracidiphilus sp.]